MSRTLSSQSNKKQGLELFSDLMLMKMKPKSIEGTKKARQTKGIRQQILRDTDKNLSSEEK